MIIHERSVPQYASQADSEVIIWYNDIYLTILLVTYYTVGGGGGGGGGVNLILPHFTSFYLIPILPFLAARMR